MVNERKEHEQLIAAVEHEEMELLERIKHTQMRQQQE